MAIKGGMAHIALFAVFQSFCLVTNCQKEPLLTGSVRIGGGDHCREEKIILIPMEEPTEETSFMEWIKIVKSPNKFGVTRMKKQLKTRIDSLSQLPQEEIRYCFSEIIQEAIYEDIPKEHSNWIVIPSGIKLYSTKDQYVRCAHIDLLRDVNISTLLQRYAYSSLDFMEVLAKNNLVKTTALAHYNGNVEQYAIEMLMIDHMINIWIPLEPVLAWPLALTPATQCDETRTTNCPHRTEPRQYLLKSESASNDWYTRWNMQLNEMFVWDSRTVAHAAVKIGDGEGKRSSIATRVLIVHPKEDFSPFWSSPNEDGGTLCYTDHFFEQVLTVFIIESLAIEVLAEMGYKRRCEDPLTNLPPAARILSHLRKLVCMFCC